MSERKALIASFLKSSQMGTVWEDEKKQQCITTIQRSTLFKACLLFTCVSVVDPIMALISVPLN